MGSDAGSADGPAEICESLGAEFIPGENSGLAAAFNRALLDFIDGGSGEFSWHLSGYVDGIAHREAGRPAEAAAAHAPDLAAGQHRPGSQGRHAALTTPGPSAM